MVITVLNEPSLAKTSYTKDDFPLVARSRHNSLVLFKEPQKGTVLYSDTYSVGHYSTRWDMQQFTKYTGTLLITGDV